MSSDKNIDANDYFELLEKLEEQAKVYDDSSMFIQALENEKETDNPDFNEDKATENIVEIMTLHASKGLEFDNVYIPDVNENILPYTKSIKDGNIEEERRLLYVGMTRARKRLRISYTESRYEKKAVPSRFLDCLMSEK